MKIIAAFLIGIVFSLGLTISQMTNPVKVLAFLDVLDSWDPSLALVMGGALIVTFLGYRLVQRRATPLLDERFHMPTKTALEPTLAGGAIMFGLGWGLAGLCPGPAIAAISIGGQPVWSFVGAMIAGMLLFEARAALASRLNRPG